MANALEIHSMAQLKVITMEIKLLVDSLSLLFEAALFVNLIRIVSNPRIPKETKKRAMITHLIPMLLLTILIVSI